MRPKNPPEIAILLANLGTPDEPTPQAVRRYLRQFLSDPRVIEIPKVIWQIILNCFVLTFRPKKVAEAYASIWQTDSPMRLILNEQVTALQNKLANEFSPFNVSVHPVMSYGNPALNTTMDALKSQGVDHFIVLPLFPQFSATSSGAVYDAVTKWLQTQRNIPNVTIIKDYFAHPLYIKALAESIKNYQAEHGKPEKLLFSFHGIPQPYADKGDPYPQRCKCTGAQVAQALGLKEDEWLTSFQSRFGKQEWVKPYTDQVLNDWGKQGVKSVQVVSPAFSADCLETLEEIAIENKHNFQQAGGGEYSYIPALNADDLHIDLLESLTKPMVEAWIKTLDGWVE